MAVSGSLRPRVSVDGKFFRAGERKFHVKGVGYGPFSPNAAGQTFASPEQTVADFKQITELGANLVRVYEVPPRWFLDLAAEHGLRVMIDIAWNQRVCFLDSPQLKTDALNAVRRGVYACARHPAVFAYSVANEIPPDIVRWSGERAVADLIDELVLEAKRVDPECLCTYTNFPSTEFLRPQNVDFVCFNVYLHQRQPFRNYLARLQMLAESKPVLLGEFGIDSLRQGEERKCEMLEWQIEEAFRGGLAGAVVFSYTDDWWHAGETIRDWGMGLTTPDRQPKQSFFTVQRMFRAAPFFPLKRTPRVSVIVASYNAERTLKACLESLEQLNYPDYEVILVDDGSTDTTSQTVSQHEKVRYIRHDRNRGLSVARNSGIVAATGEIVAFTDADCRADEDWLYYAVGAMLDSDFAGVGGPNLFPPEDSAVAAAVMASPGGPAHVMLTDRQAEHIPGCNMVFYRWALLETGCFDPIFRRAGDDVDICWRVQQAGYKLGFSPAAFVWHYRRSTIAAYLKQQAGYGEAEALLVRKHPEYFNTLGGSLWRGRIYTNAHFGLLLQPSVIYRGIFGSAGYQALYASPPALSLMLFTTLEYHALVTLPLWLLALTFHPLLPVAVTSFLCSIGVCVAAGAQAAIPRHKARWWTRVLVALLFLLQPIVRGWARYRGRLTAQSGPIGRQESLDSVALRDSGQALNELHYSTPLGVDRVAFVADVIRRLDQQGWPNKSDIGWSDHDVEIYDSRWSKLQLTTVAEELRQGAGSLRIRLHSRWSLRALIAFGSMFFAELLLLSLFAPAHRWLWVLPLTLPLAAWYLHRQNRNLQSVIAIFLDGVAKDWKFKVAGEGGSVVATPTMPPRDAQPEVKAEIRTAEAR